MPDDQQTRRMRVMAHVTAIGSEIIAAVVGGALGGWWLDGKFDTGPWLTVVGVAAGCVGAGLALIRLNRVLTKDGGD